MRASSKAKTTQNTGLPVCPSPGLSQRFSVVPTAADVMSAATASQASQPPYTSNQSYVPHAL